LQPAGGRPASGVSGFNYLYQKQTKGFTSTALTADRLPTAAVMGTIAGGQGCFRRLALDITIPGIEVSGSSISAADALILKALTSTWRRT
jgi:hypothetical protein